MNIKPLKQTAILALILVCVLVLSACGSGSPEPDLIDEDLSSHTEDEDVEGMDASPSGADDYYYIGTSLENVDVCKLIPLEDIINIVGGLREDETEVVIGQAGEVGCKYVDQKGQWYYVTYYPLGDWGFVEYTLNESEEVDGLLDGAWKGVNSSDEIHIKALAADEMVLGAFVSDGLEETAIRLVELLYEYRPK
jgi:hypothetical protein